VPRIAIAFLSFLFLIPQGLQATAQLQIAVISKVAPSTTSCTAPSQSTTFAATDTAAYVYFEVTGVNIGDTFIVAFYGPSGQLYSGSGGTSSFAGATTAGSKCYLTNNSPLLIAGNLAATMPGTWIVAIFYNGNFNTAFATGSFTITAPASTSITINNPGFETLPSNPQWIFNCGSGCQDTGDGNIPSWTASGQMGLFQPGPALFNLPLPAAEGQTVAYLNSGTLSQTLSATLQASTAYTLQVDVGRRLDNLYPSTPPTAQLYAGSMPIASATGAQPALGGWTTWTGTYQSSASDPLAGQALKIVLGVPAMQGDFDNVRLTAVQGSGTVCTYSLSANSASIPAGGGTGSFNVTAGSGCTWAATSTSPSWITITGGASGTGSGTVSYTVAANTNTSARSGTITVGGQTFTVTQAAAPAACSYSISPTSNNMTAQGGSSSITITVTAGSSCSWTASVGSSAASWLHLGPTTSGTGNGSVNYTADANTSTASRTGAITAANLTFTVTQAGGASATAPSINQGGVVNLANYRAGIARGAFFSIFGSNLGPATPQHFSQFPVPDNLGGVTVTVAQGSTSVRAYTTDVSSGQINAIMPSNAPLGNVQVTVAYGGGSGSAAATVVSNAFGILGINGAASGPGVIQNYNTQTSEPINLASVPAKPGQIEIIWGTGLGAITTPDNQASPGANMQNLVVQVLVGGKQANVIYKGRAPTFAGADNIYFTVPADAPTGCSVPVQVSAGGTWSNTVRMAISSDGSHCQDTFNPYSGLSTTGGKSGTIGLIRVNFSGQLDPTQPSTTAQLDLGIGAFALTNPGGDGAYSPITNLPPPGACAATNKALDLGTVMGDGGSSLDPTIAKGLDAGPQLTVTGGAGGATGTIGQTASASSPNSPYMGMLGGILNVEGATVPPPFLDGGPFTISGPGGQDVGPFTTTVALAPAIHWTNPPSTINRSSPLTLTWTGGNSSQLVLILGGSTDQTSKGSGGFVCLAQAAAGTFTVPADALADLISTAGATSSNGPVGMLGLMPLQPGSMNLTPLPKGLDVGVVFDTTLTVETVQVQ